MQARGSARTVEFVLDGNPIAARNGVVDFGPELAPHELTVIARDANGVELERDTQLVNLAIKPAEADILLERDGDGLRATVKWEHIAAGKPKRIALTLDGKPVTAGEKLPPFDVSAIHVLQADVEFADGVRASKELVFGGRYSEQVPSELTAVLSYSTSDCFTLRGRTIRANAVEQPGSFVQFVRNPDARLARQRLVLPGTGNASGLLQRGFAIPDVQMRIIWPYARRIEKNESGIVTWLFERSKILSGGTTYGMLTWAAPAARSLRFADALAVAGVESLAGAKRRAVVLVLSGEPDESRLEAAVVRRYLDRIGVPLRVWSLVRITPQMKEEWGEITDISGAERLRKATDELRAELSRQHIAWLAIPPLDAQHVRPCE